MFKSLNILKLLDICNLTQLKFYNKFLNLNVPAYFHTPFVTRESIHGLNTRYSQGVYVPRIYYTFVEHPIRFSIPTLINDTPRNIADKRHSHSFDSFIEYTKLKYIENYNLLFICDNCYVGGRHKTEKKYVSNKQRHQKRTTARTPKLRTCDFCGTQQEFKKGVCPALGKTCKKCTGKNHFASVCRTKNLSTKKSKNKSKVHQFEFGYCSS